MPLDPITITLTPTGDTALTENQRTRLDEMRGIFVDALRNYLALFDLPYDIDDQADAGTDGD